MTSKYPYAIGLELYSLYLGEIIFHYKSVLYDEVKFIYFSTFSFRVLNVREGRMVSNEREAST